jgi:hypothetical protein
MDPDTVPGTFYEVHIPWHVDAHRVRDKTAVSYQIGRDAQFLRNNSKYISR